MAANSASALALASRLRALDDAELIQLITERQPRLTGIRDFFDLAEALLDRASVQFALSRLDRPTLATIAAIILRTAEVGAPLITDIASALDSPGRLLDAAALADRAANLGLLESESGRYAAYDTVVEQLRAWPGFDLPSLHELVELTPPAALDPVDRADIEFVNRLASDRAFTTMTAVTELITELERQPARELARGGLALPDTKRLASAMNTDLTEVSALHDIAVRAGLIELAGGEWIATDDSTEWLLESSGARWVRLAIGWRSHLAPDIDALLGERTHVLWGDGLLDYIDWVYPAGGEWMAERIRVYSRDAELLGVTANQSPSEPAMLLFSHGVAEARDAMAALFPSEVTAVYVQQDLSIVAPGPLAPRLDARLRTVAEVENRALASTYRVTRASVSRAMSSGETAESIRSFLSEISLTGIPQPLDYLIGETAQRYGALRVGPAAEAEAPARSYLRSDDEHLLSAVAVDQNLAALGLSRASAHRLVSRFDFEVVFWSLTDASYPVAAESTDQSVIALHRRRARSEMNEPASSAAASLVRKLRTAAAPHTEETGHGWLVRQLEIAIKNKMAVTVSVVIADDSTVDYQLEPTSIAGGRLRARDRRAGIERTLPLNRIVEVTSAD